MISVAAVSVLSASLPAQAAIVSQVFTGSTDPTATQVSLPVWGEYRYDSARVISCLAIGCEYGGGSLDVWIAERRYTSGPDGLYWESWVRGQRYHVDEPAASMHLDFPGGSAPPQAYPTFTVWTSGGQWTGRVLTNGAAPRVPEPGTLALLALALVGVLAARVARPV
jgi:hypothetical protein